MTAQAKRRRPPEMSLRESLRSVFATSKLELLGFALVAVIAAALVAIGECP